MYTDYPTTQGTTSSVAFLSHGFSPACGKGSLFSRGVCTTPPPALESFRRLSFSLSLGRWRSEHPVSGFCFVMVIVLCRKLDSSEVPMELLSLDPSLWPLELGILLRDLLNKGTWLKLCGSRNEETRVYSNFKFGIRSLSPSPPPPICITWAEDSVCVVEKCMEGLEGET